MARVCSWCGLPDRDWLTSLEPLGTGLKPAHEFIVIARKPFKGTYAANVLKHGTGALNIDGCRVDAVSRPARSHEVSASGLTGTAGAAYGSWEVRGSVAAGSTDLGRWPPNLVLSHSQWCEPLGTREIRSDGHHPARRGESGYQGGWHGQQGLAERKSGTETVEAWRCADGCPVAELDRQSGMRVSGQPSANGRYGSHADTGGNAIYGRGLSSATPNRAPVGDSGGASRFFPVFRYEAKAGTAERPKGDDGGQHSTVKPLGLVRWLCRLVTRPGGLVLDMFAGSGTTGEACVIEGFGCLLIEKEEPHARLIVKRLSKPIQPVMFGGDL